MSNLTTQSMRASQEWATRPNDERFISLPEMRDHFHNLRLHSKAAVASTRSIELRPGDDNSLALFGKADVGYQPNNWSFGQLSNLAGAPAGYLRKLPAPMAADCINYGLKVEREIADIGILISQNGKNTLRAATGPNYGRIWNEQVVNALIGKFGDGVTGDWRVPGEFGKEVVVDKRNTTLYASDRDLFVFLADERNRIDVAGRKLARGFFVWNSEVGYATFGVGTFLFDFVCMNRIIWGQQDYKEIRVRHTVSAPDRFLGEVQPALQRYADSSSDNIVKAVKDAAAHRLDNVNEFLARRFGPRMVESIKTIHKVEENRPIETRFDVVVGVTALARGIEHQDARVELERQAGNLLAA